MIGWWRRPGAPQRLALLPLDSVLFPGSTLRLRQLEAGLTAHLQALAAAGDALVVSLLAADPSEVHAVGTRATLAHEAGLFRITGCARVRLLETRLTDGPARQSAVETLPAPARQPVPAPYRSMLMLLAQSPAGDVAELIAACAEDADAASYRLIDLLPVQALAKQRLLELDDPVERLHIVRRFLAQRGLQP